LGMKLSSGFPDSFQAREVLSRSSFAISPGSRVREGDVLMFFSYVLLDRH